MICPALRRTKGGDRTRGVVLAPPFPRGSPTWCSKAFHATTGSVMNAPKGTRGTIEVFLADDNLSCARVCAPSSSGTRTFLWSGWPPTTTGPWQGRARPDRKCSSPTFGCRRLLTVRGSTPPRRYESAIRVRES